MADAIPAPAPEEDPGVRMTFGEHLEELRSRLFKCIIMLLVVIVALMAVYQDLIIFITRPHFQAMELMEKDPAEVAMLPEGYQSPLLSLMKMAFIMGMFISSPWIAYQLWAFVAAGLYPREKKYVVRFAPLSFLLFTLGCIFGYVLLIPYALYGLASMMEISIVSETTVQGAQQLREHKILRPMYSFPAYLNLVLLLTIILGAVFQMPLIMVFLVKIGLVHPSKYNKWRRAAVVFNCVFAALVTPADIFTMAAVAGPMLLLYEVGVVASFMVHRGKEKEAARPAT